jgi:hypothetical protein
VPHVGCRPVIVCLFVGRIAPAIRIKSQARAQEDDMSCKLSHAYLRTYTFAMADALVVGAHAARARERKSPDSAAVAPTRVAAIAAEVAS